jgi:hypothetical protein
VIPLSDPHDRAIMISCISSRMDLVTTSMECAFLSKTLLLRSSQIYRFVILTVVLKRCRLLAGIAALLDVHHSCIDDGTDCARELGSTLSVLGVSWHNCF